MLFEIAFTPTASAHLRLYRKFEQRIIFDGIEEQLSYEPTTETQNRKQLRANEWSTWELRIRKYRVFYDVLSEQERSVVSIRAIGHKEHNTLYIGGKEVNL
jgi:mRNA-degrading endonuclease RelE of RelBE toxin-antitoxin system